LSKKTKHITGSDLGIEGTGMGLPAITSFLGYFATMIEVEGAIFEPC
jgi:hypothetical protein